MKFTLSWLGEHLDTSATVAEVVDELCREYEQACSRLQCLRTSSRKVIA